MDAKQIEKLIEENDRMRDALKRIADWQKAYPLEAFPEPDLKRAHEVLKAAGMGLDGISASNMRHVLNGIKGIVEAGLVGLDNSPEEPWTQERNTLEIEIFMKRAELTVVQIQRALGFKNHGVVSDTINGGRQNRRVLQYLLNAGCPAKHLGLPKNMIRAAKILEAKRPYNKKTEA